MLRFLWFALVIGVMAALGYVLLGRYRPATGGNGEMGRHLDGTANAVLAGDWPRAVAGAEKLAEAWRQIGYRRQSRHGKSNPATVKADLTRLRQAGLARDKPAALQVLGNLRDYWEEPEKN